MNIAMVDITKEKHFVVPEDGNYLVRRESNISGVSTSWFSTKVIRHHDTKRNIYTNSFDCKGVEGITHISVRPLPSFLVN
jgi:hypothetical protein